MSKNLLKIQTIIFNSFGGNFIKLGNSFYTAANDSMKLINFCEKHNMIILGIETFKLFISNKISIQPNMEDDIYYSEKYKKNNKGNYQWDIARQFIKDKQHKNVIFEVDFDIATWNNSNFFL
jgi:hypothetical protein